jgi:hypothetical protein
MFAKAGIAKRVVDEARKPENQQKVKDLVAKVRDQGDHGDRGGETRR